MFTITDHSNLGLSILNTYGSDVLRFSDEVLLDRFIFSSELFLSAANVV